VSPQGEALPRSRTPDDQPRDDMLRTLGSIGTMIRPQEKVAKKVIELAQTGDCDPSPLKGANS